MLARAWGVLLSLESLGKIVAQSLGFVTPVIIIMLNKYISLSWNIRQPYWTLSQRTVRRLFRRDALKSTQESQLSSFNYKGINRITEAKKEAINESEKA